MCSPYDAVPPDLPPGLTLRHIGGGAAAERLTLTAADGTRFAAAFAESPNTQSRSGIVVLPDARGLYPFYERLAERFAEAGHHAIAIDYFGRTAGVGTRGDSFEFMPHVTVAEARNVQADVAAAIEHLRDRAGATALFTVGFCFGGTNAFLTATRGDLGLSGAVGFYGGLDPAAYGAIIPSPVDHSSETEVPVLGLFGGGDQSIPQARIDAFGEGLRASGVVHEIHVYPDAPHSFFDRSYEQWRDASADAWNRVLEFIESVSLMVAAS
jgi:carboxymethylenebutenolidase